MVAESVSHFAPLETSKMRQDYEKAMMELEAPRNELMSCEKDLQKRQMWEISYILKDTLFLKKIIQIHISMVLLWGNIERKTPYSLQLRQLSN